MDMSQYGSALFIKRDDVRDRPRRALITGVEIDEKFGRPLLLFDDGTRLTANKTNVANLIKAYGPDNDDWIGMEVELFLGETTYNNTKQPSVLVAPISAPHSARDRSVSAAPAVKKKMAPKTALDTFGAGDAGDTDDEIPF